MAVYKRDAISNLVLRARYYITVNKKDSLTDEQVNDLYESAGAYGLDPSVMITIDAMLPDIYNKSRENKTQEAIDMVVEALEKKCSLIRQTEKESGSWSKN